MSSFQRARSEEQREIRRQAILDTAATMLSELPVSALTLNGLARRVGLAKSNVLRYFESREAVLLDLVNLLAGDFAIEVVTHLPGSVEPSDSVHVRSRSVASTLAASFARHPMLCELLSVQAGILEHNISAEVATRYKRTAYQTLGGLADALRDALPELAEQDAAEAVRLTMVLVGAIWTHTHPATAVQDAYDADPNLQFLPQGFAGSLQRAISLVLLGILADRGDTAK